MSRNRRPATLLPAAALLAVLLTGAGALAGCTGAPASTAGSSDAAGSTAAPTAPDESTLNPSPTVPEPTPAIPAYTAEELRDTISKAGYPCTTWTPSTIDAGDGSGVGTGGFCQESMVGAFTFPDQAAVQALLDRSEKSSEPQQFLVGNRWVVTVGNPASSGEELIALQDLIGGALVGPDL